jgi:glucosamine--fructose-6-phosphate aminotransferase (isomerizing)
MLKEMMEQPTAIADTLRGRLSSDSKGLQLDIDLPAPFLNALEKVTFVACGTSYHAALVARFWFESIAKIPCQVEIASEFRYRPSFLGKKDLSVFVSQSGETADTLAAMRLAKSSGARTLAICNVLGSSMTSEAHTTLYTHCGPEIGVASTKAFTGQLTALLLLAVHIGSVRGALDGKKRQEIVDQMMKLPAWIRETLKVNPKVLTAARKFYATKSHFLYLGRNLNYPIALEGALKLKEISYIHAEGYPAGELKHGPIALIDKDMPLVALATESAVYEKIVSNIEEAKARGGIVIAVANQGDSVIRDRASEVFFVPRVPEIFSPIINVIPLQLLAYHNGTDLTKDGGLIALVGGLSAAAAKIFSSE